MTLSPRARFLLFLLPILTAGTRAQSPPDAQEILKKLTEKFNEVRDYSADITAEIHFERMRFPKMEAAVSFRQPDKMAIEPRNGSFAMIPRDAVGFNPNALSLENYDAVVQGREAVGGIDCYKVKLLARSDTIRVQRLMLFVDPQYWIVRRIQVTPDRGGNADALFEYQLVQDKFLMWSRITLTMDVPTFGRMKPQQEGGTEPQKGSVTVRYDNYRINKGIPDEVFRRTEKKR